MSPVDTPADLAPPSSFGKDYFAAQTAAADDDFAAVVTRRVRD